MRALGVHELETATGHVRRVTLGDPVPLTEAATLGLVPKPETADADAPVDAPRDEAAAEAAEAARKQKIEQRTFAAGRGRGR